MILLIFPLAKWSWYSIWKELITRCASGEESDHEQYPEIPSPQEFGFHIYSDTGKLELLWFEGDVIPKDLINVLLEEEEGEEKEYFDEIHISIEDNSDDDEEEENDGSDSE